MTQVLLPQQVTKGSRPGPAVAKEATYCFHYLSRLSRKRLVSFSSLAQQKGVAGGVEAVQEEQKDQEETGVE